jgi:hypothetical protein
MDTLIYQGVKIQKTTNIFLYQNKNNPELTDELRQCEFVLVPCMTTNTTPSFEKYLRKMIVTTIRNDNGTILIDTALSADSQKLVMNPIGGSWSVYSKRHWNYYEPEKEVA